MDLSWHISKLVRPDEVNCGSNFEQQQLKSEEAGSRKQGRRYEITINLHFEWLQVLGSPLFNSMFPVLLTYFPIIWLVSCIINLHSAFHVCTTPWWR